LSQSVASELLEAFRAGEGVDLVRESVRLVMQELIETEASERIGADRCKRTETRITDRNGSRPRLLATQAGDVQLRIPKLRKGSFFPVILEPRRPCTKPSCSVISTPPGPDASMRRTSPALVLPIEPFGRVIGAQV